MQHYERIDPLDEQIISITRFGHIERYRLARDLITQDSLVLDAACGYGYGTDMMKRKAAYTVGIDKDEATIGICRNKYGKEKKLEFLVSDIGELPFPDSSFDYVLGIEMIEHINYPERFISEAHRVLKTKGSIMISTPYGDNTLLKGGIPFSDFHVKEYRESEIKDMLKDSGFELKKTYGQYIILGTIMRLTDNRIKPISRIDAGESQSVMERIPLFAELFSRHYPFLKSTAKNMFYHAIKM